MRPFSAHGAGYGDLHEGGDFYTVVGDSILSGLKGRVIREHFTHFGFERAEQLDQFTLTAPSSALTATLGTNALELTCARVGAKAFPAQVDTYAMVTRLCPSQDDWTLEIKLSATPSFAAGEIGIGLFGPGSTEYIGLGLGGSGLFTIHAKTNGSAWAQDGNTYTVTGSSWFKIEYTKTTDTYVWAHSPDGDEWTTLASATTQTWLALGDTLTPAIYWRSGDTDALAHAVSVLKFNLGDEYRSIRRFGNWVRIDNGTWILTLAHLSTVLVQLGEEVSSGQLIGEAGSTGFDPYSKRIRNEHCHAALTGVRGYAYARSDQINPLGIGRIPHAVTSTVTCTRTTATAPIMGVSAHKFAISCARGDQNFIFDSLLVTLSGGATRLIRFDTREGFDPANRDSLVYNGVEFTPHPFDEESGSYDIDIYVDASLGSYVSHAVKDTAGNAL
jgi:hypothetical protein